MSDFAFDDNPDLVARYDEGPSRFVPGYAASHITAATILADRVGESANILVVGAGGGVEIAAFHRLCATWRYVGIDPSAAMNDLARRRFDRDCPEVSAELLLGTVDEAPAGPFDAATAFLCLMFAPDDGARLAQLRAIHARLKPGTPFLMMHAASTPETIERDFERFALHARMQGADEETIDMAIAFNRTHVHIVSPEREEELLAEAGFKLDGLFHSGLWIRGWEASA